MYDATWRPSAPSTTTAVSSSFSPMTAATDVDVLGDGAAVGQRLGQQRRARRPCRSWRRGTTMSAASCWNCSFFATKSVSQLSWIIAPSAAATRPLVALRSAPRSLTLVSPLMRSSSAALSWSPSASSRAFFAAIMPAPVASRSFLTSAAVMFAMVLCLALLSVSGVGWAARRAARSRPASGAGSVPAASVGLRGAAASAAGPRRRVPRRQVPRRAAASAAGASAAVASGAAGVGGGALGRRRLGAGALDGLALRPGVPSAAVPRCSSSCSHAASGSSVAS